jgi:hypothetical protein
MQQTVNNMPSIQHKNADTERLAGEPVLKRRPIKNEIAGVALRDVM